MTVNVVLASIDMFTPPCSPNSWRRLAKDWIGSSRLMVSSLYRLARRKPSLGRRVSGISTACVRRCQAMARVMQKA